MNWEALGATAELLGAVGVIISLLYLAKQIRISSAQTEQNSKITRGTAYQQFRQQVNSVVALRVADPELSRIWETGFLNPEKLTDSEFSRLSGVIFMMVGNWESHFYLQQSGVFEEGMGADRSLIVKTPGFRQWLALRKETYAPDFRQVIEDESRQENSDDG